MADCFSFLNAAKLVEHLRNHIKLSHEGRIYIDIGSEIFCKQAADTIEQLLAENEKLKAERDAAVADLKTVTHMDDVYRFMNKIPPIEQFQLIDDIRCGLCPWCNEGVNEEMNYCSYCGQELDWDDRVS